MGGAWWNSVDSLSQRKVVMAKKAQLIELDFLASLCITTLNIKGCKEHVGRIAIFVGEMFCQTA